jgi:hypothetical protein
LKSTVGRLVRVLLRRAAVVLALLLFTPAPGRAGWKDDVRLNGYIRESPFVWSEPSTGRNLTNLVHTRENLRVYPSPSLTVGVELKTRLFAGDAAQTLLDRADLTGGSRAWLDLDRRLVDEENLVLVSGLDRAWVNVERGAAQLTVGRQRVAWGTGLVWNPTDIFNASSPLDFDNEEKPGTDAARLQVYTGPNSKMELAVAPMRRADDTIAAAQLTLNCAGYDWSAMGGRRGPVTVLGGSWAGSIGGGGFRGELLHSAPRGGLSRWSATVEGDYTFANSLYLHAAALYNERGSTGDAGGFLLLQAYQRRWLTSARASLFGEVAGDVNPLVRADLAALLNPYDRSWYTGPTVTWSVATNLDFTASALLFGGAAGTEFGDDGGIVLLRLQRSF